MKWNSCYFEFFQTFFENYKCFTLFVFFCVFFFFVTILKFVDGFPKRTIYGIPSTFGSYQNHYQGNVYACLFL